MIMSSIEGYNAPQLIADGYKTETRRLYKPGELWINGVAYTDKGQRKFYPGQVRHVRPARTAKGLYYKFINAFYQQSHDAYGRGPITKYASVEAMESDNWQPLKIEIISVDLQMLGDIDRQSAYREGIGVRFHNNGDMHYDYEDQMYKHFGPIDSYKSLWRVLHGEWNPQQLVWVIKFKHLEV